ncbi:MAG: dCMP deaminase family protein [Candidatus Berkelbacteria bacterium]
MLEKDNQNSSKQGRISWDEFFMRMAVTAASRTACLLVKAGSVFVDEDHRVVSIGYNGPTAGDYHCNEVGCAKIHGDPVTGELQRCRGAHGEMNAIVNSGNTERLKNSTLYVTAFPCWDCMKVLNNLGVRRIVYLQDYARTIEGSKGEVKVIEDEARELAGRRGIAIEKFRGNLGGLTIFQEDKEVIRQMFQRPGKDHEVKDGTKKSAKLIKK